MNPKVSEWIEKILPSVLLSYKVCALWSSNNDEGEPLDNFYTLTDLERHHDEMRAEVLSFLAQNEVLLWQSGLGPEQIGHDLWLTRNHHGAGFWDRGLGEIGDLLTTEAHRLAECYLYEGDDGCLYLG